MYCKLINGHLHEALSLLSQFSIWKLRTEFFFLFHQRSVFKISFCGHQMVVLCKLVFSANSCHWLNLSFRYGSVLFQWGSGFWSSVHRHTWVKRQPWNANPEIGISAGGHQHVLSYL